MWIVLPQAERDEIGALVNNMLQKLESGSLQDKVARTCWGVLDRIFRGEKGKKGDRNFGSTTGSETLAKQHGWTGLK